MPYIILNRGEDADVRAGAVWIYDNELPRWSTVRLLRRRRAGC